MGAVTSVMRAQQVLVGRLNGILKPHGLTFPRYEALMVLHRATEPLPLSRLGEQLQVHKATVTSIVDRLEAQALAERLHDRTDRRAVLAQITSEGQRVAEAASADVAAAAFAIPDLDTHALDALYALLTPLRRP